MSKLQDSEFGDDELPPPYTPVASQEGGLFDSHVRSILQRAESAQASAENQILASLVDPTDSFLASISGVRPSTKLVEGVFVPAEALGPGWRLTEEGDKSKGELSRIVRVEQRQHGKEDTKEKPSSSYRDETPCYERGFTEWGRWDDDDKSGEDSESMLWWADEDLARRLARQLQPAQPHSQKSSQSAGGSGGGTLRRTLSGFSGSKAAAQEEEGSAITVRAEEVTFRRENEMGIWESRTGWCIVVRVRLQR